MNCRNWEERIALYAGGDLPAEAAAEAERHLAGCAGCREFAAGVQASLETLRAVHEEPLAPVHFAAVRARVLGRLEAERPPWWRWAFVPALAAGLVAVFLWVHQPAVQPPRVAIAPPPAPKAEPLPPAVASALPKRVVRVRRVKKPLPPPPAEPLMVKLVTDDPNVVIYWIAN